ncbi:uncharacterized protein LOC105699669 isoform X2 [Orussus abietinus]|nr:uncharacterized protein LOC105699669 isoform X2 [Orussus abietinus]XP_012280247.1 uncharacterized protein LOC105699669 isoform X2 [Orussus abietinus]
MKNNFSPDRSLINYIKKTLVGKIFIGSFVGKQYVECLQLYRDIIHVHTNEEELIVSLNEVQSQICKYYGNSRWFGMTCEKYNNDNVKYIIWTTLPEIPLGKYWFQICPVKYTLNEIQLKVKHLRALGMNNEDPVEKNYLSSFDLQKIFTLENTYHTLRFNAVAILTLVTTAMTLLWHIGDFSLKFVHCFCVLIQVFTPIILAIINGLTKCVGGLYWLIYVILRGDQVPPWQQFDNNDQQRRNHYQSSFALLGNSDPKPANFSTSPKKWTCRQ